MKKIYWAIFTALLYFASAPGVMCDEPDEKYKVGRGDVLFVSVWKDEALSRQVIIQPDGNISFPLIDEISAAGKTIHEVKKEISQKISRFVPDPILTVGVQQVNSMVIYVIGKVNRPGHYPIHKNITVLQALSMAGGMNAFSEEDDIMIFREHDDKTEIIQFDYEEVSQGENLAQNIKLRRGDVIIVP